MKCDVVVLGGGSAGFAAAITAARTGALTLLVERDQSLGGMASTALVHSICGLYRLHDGADAILAHSGFPAEFAAKLIAAGGAGQPVRMGKLDVLLHHPPIFAETARTLAEEEERLVLRLGTSLRKVSRRGDGFSMLLRNREDEFGVESRVLVDTTGDAALAPLLDLEWEIAPAERLQRPAFIFSIQGVAASLLEGDGRLFLAQHIARGVQKGELSRGALGAHFRLGHLAGEVFVTIDLACDGTYTPFDPAILASLHLEGHQLAEELLAFLQETQPAFAEAKISMLPERLGVRESRRLIGKATVSQADVLEGIHHEDVVALNAWPIELREKNTGPKWRFPKEGRLTQIPAGALRPRDGLGLWMAGRCVSAEHEAQAALRVIGTCMATGQAAGAAAALEALHGGCPSAAEVRACTGFVLPVM